MVPHKHFDVQDFLGRRLDSSIFCVLGSAVVYCYLTMQLQIADSTDHQDSLTKG
jgi:hypothetical protein